MSEPPAASAIGGVPGFEVLSRVEADRLGSLATARRWRQGEPVEPGRDLVIVAGGALEVALAGSGPGRPLPFAAEASGGLLGEVGLFVHDAERLTGLAVDDSDGFTVSRRALKTAFHYSRPLAVKFMVISARGLARKLRAATRALQDLEPEGGKEIALAPPPEPLAEDDLRRLRAASETRCFATGETIFAEGDRSRELCVLREGSVEVCREQDGRTLRLAELGPGDFFGEMAFVDDAPRSASVRATSPVRISVLPAGVLERALEIDTAVAVYVTNALCKAMARRLDATLKRLGRAATERG